MKKLLFLILIIPLLLHSQEKVTYSFAKIYISDPSSIEILLKNGIAADEGKVKPNKYIESIFSSDEIKKAKELGFDVEIMIEDWQQHYHQNVKNAPATKNPGPCDNGGFPIWETPTHFNLGSMGGFLNYTEFLAEMEEMRNLYPNLITAKEPISSFTTFENRPIYWFRISDNPEMNEENEQEVLYTAIHHAREPGSLQELVFFMWYILENYSTDPTIQSLVDNSELYFVPVINPDGYVYNQTTDPNGGGMWRKNRRNNGNGTYGVDNNRNYSFHWGETGVSDNSSGETWPGTGPFSESENQAIKWFVEQHDFILALNAHTFSELLLYPYGYQYNTYTPDNDTFVAITEEMVAENGYDNQISWELYPASGDSDDWMYEATAEHGKIYALTPEVSYSFWPSQNDIVPICKEMMHLNLTGLKLVHNYPQITAQVAGSIDNLNASFAYSLKNLTVVDSPANFEVSIVPVSSNILSVGTPQIHNNVQKLATVDGSVDFTLNPDINVGELVSFKLIVNNGLFSNEVLVEKAYGDFNVLVADNCNSISPNWIGANWGISTSTYVSPTGSITDSPSGDYANDTNKTITSSNGFDLTEAMDAKCTFYAKWAIENDYDYVQFEISTDNGSTWQPQCGNYTNAGVEDQNVAGEPLYDGAQNSWVLEEISLSDYIGSTIKCRFQLFSDYGVTEDGFYFDDFNIEILEDSSAGVEENHLSHFLLFPNPSATDITVYHSEDNEIFNVAFYNVNGQLIYNDYRKSGDIIHINNFESGIYFVKMGNDSNSKIVKFIKQ